MLHFFTRLQFINQMQTLVLLTFNYGVFLDFAKKLSILFKMKKHKLFRFLLLMEVNQLLRFSDFIASPYFNTNKRVMALGQYIVEYMKTASIDYISHETLFKVTFPGEPYQDNKLRAMLSIVTKLAEEFLVAEHVKANSAVKQQLLLQSTRLIDDAKLYQGQLNKSYEMQQQSNYRDIDYYFAHHQVEEANYNFAVKNKDKDIGKSLTNMLGNLDLYYLSKRLKYSCESINRRNILGEDQGYMDLTLISDLLNHHELNLPPVALIYRQILFLFEEEEHTDHFYKLIDLLRQYDPLFTRDELKVMYGYAMNYCIRKINAGKSVFLQEIFNLYKTLLEQDIIFEGRYISQWDYKNIVTTGLRLNDIEWTAGFVTKYKTMLHPDVRENAYAYNYANLSYFKRDYEITMQLLQQVEFTNDSYLLSSRSLLLKSYYELEEYELLNSQSEAFKLYLRRNKQLPDYQKSLYKNMIKYIVKLSRYKASGQKVPDKLKLAITQQQDIADLTWLRNKLSELD